MNARRSSAIFGFSVLALLLIAMPGEAAIHPARILLKVDHLARIQLGNSIDALPSISRERTQFKVRQSLARFHLYYFNASLPERCMNLQCGTFAIQILAHGGFLMGGADTKYLSDIEGASREPVLLVTDRRDRVEAIYSGLTQAEFRFALRSVIKDPALR